MKTLDTIAGHTYVVSSPNGGTVTSADGLVKETVEAGKQKVVFGTGAPLQLDDDAGKIMATFKLAPAKLMALGLLGGGEVAPSLPAGYLAAEFLESTGTQYISFTGLEVVEEATQIVEAQRTKTTGVSQCIFGFSWNTQQFIQGVNKALKWSNFQANVLDRCVLEHSVNTTTKIATFTYASSSVQKTCSNGALNQWGLWSVVNKNQCDAPDLRVFEASLLWGGVKKFKFSPAIDAKGVPCMFDKVSKQPFYNSGSGQFIVGMNMKQALKLSKLPAGGGTLTVSLPTGYEADAGVATALETARANGWTLTIQTYTPEAESSSASTFGMRRIWVRRTQDENGTYVDTDGTRWQVEWCVEMYTPDGSTPDMHGYEMYRSVDAAVAYWELEPWIDPEAEKLMQEELLTEYNEQ